MGNEKYLIKNTTKEERQKIVSGAIVVSMLDSKEPSDDDKKLYQKYIDGKKEISEILQEAIKKYKRN